MYVVDPWEDLQDAVCVLRKDNYEVHGTIGLRASTKRTFTAVLDTGAGPNLVHPRVLPLCWERMVQEKKSGKVPDALIGPWTFVESLRSIFICATCRKRRGSTYVRTQRQRVP